MTTPQGMLADRLIGIQEDLPNEDDRNALGEAAHYLRQAARGREHKQLQALWQALDGGPKPLCRDCADHDGNCPSNGLPCDPQERALAQIKALRVDSGREDVTIPLEFIRNCGCPSDRRMTVGECTDRGTCGCSLTLRDRSRP